MKLYSFMTLFFVLFFVGCKAENTVEMRVPELLSLLSPEDAIIYLNDREIDTSLTSSCGTASPATTSMGIIPGQTTPQQPTGGNTQNRSRFTIFSQLIMKYTKEVLTMRFTYDLNQFQGNIDPQQGFVLTGDLYKRTITGNQGIVKWYNQGLGYINTSGQSSGGVQSLSFMTVELNLTGVYNDAATSTTTQPFQCPTLNNQTCEYGAVTNGRTCFTTDNLTCIVNTSSTGGTTVTIIGTVKCNAQNVRPN
jgi:hypothetical protein